MVESDGRRSTSDARDELPDDDPVRDRLESQLEFYGSRSRTYRRRFMALKVVQMIVAGAIPVAVALDAPNAVAAVLGALVLLDEGLLQLGQYQQDWTRYRATAEALKHEQFLFLARAGDYAVSSDPRRLLAEQVESLVSTENARWVDARREPASKTAQPAGRDGG